MPGSLYVPTVTRTEACVRERGATLELREAPGNSVRSQKSEM